MLAGSPEGGEARNRNRSRVYRNFCACAGRAICAGLLSLCKPGSHQHAPCPVRTPSRGICHDIGHAARVQCIFGFRHESRISQYPHPRSAPKVSGVVTQDKLYCWCRMPFGFNMAPAHFQYVMHTPLNVAPTSRRPNHATYVDDVHVGGSGLY